MKKIILIASVLLCTLVLRLPAQKLALEKTYEITGKAKRGYLDEVVYDAAAKTTQLSFVTRETTNLTGSKSKVKYQDYFFDKDFNFIRMDEKVDEYRNKRYKGDNYEVEGVSVQNNLLGTFVLRKKLISYTWDWFFGGYRKKVKLLEKVKPRDDSGNKYSLVSKFENDQTGEVIAMVRTKGKTDVPNEYTILKIDKNLVFEVTDKAAFEDPQVLVVSSIIPDIRTLENDDSALEENEEEESEESDDQGDLSTSDAGFVFAPSVAGKRKDSDPHNYTFWRINAVGKIVEKTAVRASASVWHINQIVTTGESIYIMGPANEGKFHDQVKEADPENAKWKLFQLAKISGSKTQFVTVTNLDDFESHLKTPPSQKRSPSYSGKRFHFTAADVYSDGSILIAGQNYSWEKIGKIKHKQYKDVIMFHFDNSGKLKSQYGVRREENNRYAKIAPAAQLINDGKSTVYWTVMEMDGIREEKEGKVRIVKPLLYPSVARIDPATGNISDFVQFGYTGGKPHYYLHYNFPILPMSEENAVVYMGVDKPGKVLWFGKVILD